MVAIVNLSKYTTEELRLSGQLFFGDGQWVLMRPWKVFIDGLGGLLS
jgi:hypothetical protein